ncbi:DUF5071 domain-containing protein [Aminipila sp.]|uniref:DUF5071 domain-containing protein n=1 Tax=Aminipila sp. TaxID=2060095 RepID=UPI00289AD912|nr:DUF5071 domain-containing protein [Aminipila sp.]
MKQDIDTLLQKLSWDKDTNIQQKAVKELIEIDEKDIFKLIQPKDKNHWDNAALVLKQIGYPRNKSAIPGLIEWLQDMNWPGAWTALETLQAIDIPILIPYIENALKKALQEDDEMWLMGLKELVINRLRVAPTDFTNLELYKMVNI